MQKEYPIPAKELTKLLKDIKAHLKSSCFHIECTEDLEKIEAFDKKVNNFFHFQCGVPLKDLTTENVLSDKFKI